MRRRALGGEDEADEVRARPGVDGAEAVGGRPAPAPLKVGRQGRAHPVPVVIIHKLTVGGQGRGRGGQGLGVAGEELVQVIVGRLEAGGAQADREGQAQGQVAATARRARCAPVGLACLPGLQHVPVEDDGPVRAVVQLDR